MDSRGVSQMTVEAKLRVKQRGVMINSKSKVILVLKITSMRCRLKYLERRTGKIT